MPWGNTVCKASRTPFYRGTTAERSTKLDAAPLREGSQPYH